jgi:integral membrane protein
MGVHMNVLKRFEQARPFTEQEAWNIFRLAAIAEAVGWTLLCLGIVLTDYVTHGDRTWVIIGGRIHGMLFFAYLAACVVLYPSLGWSRLRALFALAFSVPPYGSLMFEQWMARRRSSGGFNSYRQYVLYTVLLHRA